MLVSTYPLLHLGNILSNLPTQGEYIVRFAPSMSIVLCSLCWKVGGNEGPRGGRREALEHFLSPFLHSA